MKLDVKSISGEIGAQVSFDCFVDMSGIDLYGEYPFANPVHMRGYVVNHAGLYELHASAETVLKVQCARCAKEFEKEKKVDIFETLADGGEDEDVIVMHDMVLDLDDVCISAVLLDMDRVNLCREDCKGLCPVCGTDLNEGTCNCRKKEIDPRLAPLQQLLKK